MKTDRRKLLGQYFTPPSVVDFILDALEWLGAPRCSESRRVIDPACGEGAFLNRILRRNLARPENIYGLDRDAALEAGWREGGPGGADGPHIGLGDGLLAEAVGDRRIGPGEFDWVVGNPPYAGEGLKQAPDETVARILEGYDLARLRSKKAPATAEQVRRMPVEVLFLERFVRLARPGGWVGVVLPEGIFANARWRYVREWLLESCTVHAVVSLPRHAFGSGRTTARTCAAIIQTQPAPADHETLLAEVERIGLRDDHNELADVLTSWHHGEEMATDPQPWKMR